LIVIPVLSIQGIHDYEAQHPDLRLSALSKGGGPAVRLVVGSLTTNH